MSVNFQDPPEHHTCWMIFGRVNTIKEPETSGFLHPVDMDAMNQANLPSAGAPFLLIAHQVLQAMTLPLVPRNRLVFPFPHLQITMT
jgi:hypothetical protein